MTTPGPWAVSSEAMVLRFGDCVLSFQIWGLHRIGFVESQNVGLQEAAANARLIAAAPDLLAALVRLGELPIDCSQEDDRVAWDQAHAAIAKAQGKAS